MNTVSPNKTRKRPVARVAGLLVLAVLAIAFFAFPFTAFAGKCGGGGGGNDEEAKAVLFGSFNVPLLSLKAVVDPTTRKLMVPSEFTLDINQVPLANLKSGQWCMFQPVNKNNGQAQLCTVVGQKGNKFIVVDEFAAKAFQVKLAVKK